MTAHRGLFVRQTGTAPDAKGTTPSEARLAMAGLVAENAPGVPRQGLLAQSATNVVVGTATMAYDVAPINPVISRSVSDGIYLPTFTGTSNVPTTDAPASGARIDLIWVKQNDAEAGDPDNFAVLGVTQGLAAPAPARPTASVPDGAYVIASAKVNAGAVATSGAAVVITQEWVHTASRGAPIRIRDLSDRAAITSPFAGQRITRLDRNRHVQEWDGTKWVWVSTPERYYADPASFSTTLNQSSKLVGSVTTVPPRTYATQVRVNGRLTVNCGAIASGALQLRICVSAAVATAGAAQARSLMSLTAPGNAYETRGAETNWIAVAAGVDPLVRIWIDHVSGGVNEGAVNSPADSHLWVDILPAND